MSDSARILRGVGRRRCAIGAAGGTAARVAGDLRRRFFSARHAKYIGKR
jgi:hypothetical protein